VAAIRVQKDGVVTGGGPQQHRSEIIAAGCPAITMMMANRFDVCADDIGKEVSLLRLKYGAASPAVAGQQMMAPKKK